MKIYRDEGAIDRQHIDKFESDFGVSLPEVYKSLLSKHNGLVPEENCFKYINVSGDEDEASISFEAFGLSMDDANSIERVQGTFDIYGYKDVIAFGHCASGDYICLDYRNNLLAKNPPVVLMFHDDFIEDTQGQPKMLIINVAINFESFMKMLYSPDEDE